MGDEHLGSAPLTAAGAGVAVDDERPLTGLSTHERLLQVAMRRFADEGFDGVSVRSLCAEVGINPATLYHHFPSKRELYVATLRQAYGQQAERIRHMALGSGTPEQRLRAVIAALCSDLCANPELVKLVKREQLQGDPERMELLAGDLLRDEVGALVSLAEEFHSDLDPLLVVYTILGTILHHVETRSFRRLMPGYRAEHEEPEVLAEHVSRVVLRALSPRGAVVRNPDGAA